MAKQRQVRMEQRVFSPEMMEDMQNRTDEQLEAETKYRSVAYSILGARAAERYDSKAARAYFQKAIAASRPQERMQIRRMAEASLALAERRAGDLKEAVEKLGQAPPTTRQLFGLRMMGLIVPPPGSSVLLRVRGFVLIIVLIAAIVGLGLGVVELISLPFGGIGIAPGILLGVLLMAAVIAILVTLGRRRQKAAQERARTGG